MESLESLIKESQNLQIRILCFSELWGWPGSDALKGTCQVFQVGVHGFWGTVYLLVPEKPRPSVRQWSIQVPKCLCVSLDVNETSRILADN